MLIGYNVLLFLALHYSSSSLNKSTFLVSNRDISTNKCQFHKQSNRLHSSEINLQNKITHENGLGGFFCDLVQGEKKCDHLVCTFHMMSADELHPLAPKNLRSERVAGFEQQIPLKTCFNSFTPTWNKYAASLGSFGLGYFLWAFIFAYLPQHRDRGPTENPAPHTKDQDLELPISDSPGHCHSPWFAITLISHCEAHPVFFSLWMEERDASYLSPCRVKVCVKIDK